MTQQNCALGYYIILFCLRSWLNLGLLANIVPVTVSGATTEKTQCKHKKVPCDENLRRVFVCVVNHFFSCPALTHEWSTTCIRIRQNKLDS